MIGDEEHELKQVMHEVTHGMNGRAVALSLHPDEPQPARILFSDVATGLSSAKLLALLSRLDAQTGRGKSGHQWVEAPVEGFTHVLCIPIERIPAFSRLQLTVFFDALTVARQRCAEAAYLERRPFASCYFRLWQLNQLKSRQIETLEAAVDLSEPGFVLLDGYGGPMYISKGAEALLSAGNGIRRVGDTISGTHRKEALMLKAAIDHVILAQTGDDIQKPLVMRLTRESAPALLVSVLAPTRSPADPQDVAAIIYLHDPTINLEQMFGQLRQLYDLTPVEARLACLLVSGQALTEAAASMRIKEQSARSCLKQVFGKTQTHRQADLIRLLLSNFLRTSKRDS